VACKEPRSGSVAPFTRPASQSNRIALKMRLRHFTSRRENILLRHADYTRTRFANSCQVFADDVRVFANVFHVSANRFQVFGNGF